MVVAQPGLHNLQADTKVGPGQHWAQKGFPPCQDFNRQQDLVKSGLNLSRKHIFPVKDVRTKLSNLLCAELTSQMGFKGFRILSPWAAVRGVKSDVKPVSYLHVRGNRHTCQSKQKLMNTGTMILRGNYFTHKKGSLAPGGITLSL